MPREYFLVLLVICLLATIASIRTTFLAWFMPSKLRKEIDGRAKVLTDAYPTTSFWRNASINKIRLVTTIGFVFVLLMDIFLYRLFFGR